jgi:hypothetical protein
MLHGPVRTQVATTDARLESAFCLCPDVAIADPPARTHGCSLADTVSSASGVSANSPKVTISWSETDRDPEFTILPPATGGDEGHVTVIDRWQGARATHGVDIVEGNGRVY